MAGRLVFSAYVQGASHTPKNQPCEDYALAYLSDDGRGGAILVDSDGHGEERAFRAADGARFACEVARDVLMGLVGEEAEGQVRQQIARSEMDFFTKLEGAILRGWLNRVEQDIAERPFAVDPEWDRLGTQIHDYFADGTRGVKAYGCTLTAAFVVPGYWFVVSIGDSPCFVATGQGTYRNPLPAVEGNIVNIVHSMCETNAMKGFSHYFSDQEPEAVFVMSDGVDESFSKSGLNLAKYLRELTVPFFEKRAGAQEGLVASLQKLTNAGSADDVSVAAVIRGDRPAPEPRYTLDQMKQIYEEAELDIGGLKGSIENNGNALRQAQDELNAKISAVAKHRSVISQFEQDVAGLEVEVARIGGIKAENEARLEALTARLGRMKAEIMQAQEPRTDAAPGNSAIVPGGERTPALEPALAPAEEALGPEVGQGAPAGSAGAPADPVARGGQGGMGGAPAQTQLPADEAVVVGVPAGESTAEEPVLAEPSAPPRLVELTDSAADESRQDEPASTVALEPVDSPAAGISDGAFGAATTTDARSGVVTPEVRESRRLIGLCQFCGGTLRAEGWTGRKRICTRCGARD